MVVKLEKDLQVTDYILELLAQEDKHYDRRDNPPNGSKPRYPVLWNGGNLEGSRQGLHRRGPAPRNPRI